MAWCACKGCTACTLDPETGECCQNIAKKEKSTRKLGMQMCTWCAYKRDNTARSSNSSAEREDVEERVRLLESLVESLQDRLSTSLTLVEDHQHQLEQAVQRITELETTVNNWPQWQPQQW